MRNLLSDIAILAIIMTAALAYAGGIFGAVQSAMPDHVYAQYAGGE